jgi:hypothetical protein
MFMKKPGAASGLEHGDGEDTSDTEKQAEKAQRSAIVSTGAIAIVTGDRSMCNTPSTASPLLRPPTSSTTLFGKVLVGTKIAADEDMPPPRPSYNGVAARKSLLNMAAEFD